MVEDPELWTSAAAASSGVRSGSKSVPESHLHAHGHLTNNIHLRNLFHMQRQRVLMEARNPNPNPNPSELPLMKELTILRKARSLRDPSTSPAWSNSSSYGGSRRMQGHNNNNNNGPGGKPSSAREEEGRGRGDTGIRNPGPPPGGDSGDGMREKVDLSAGGYQWVGELLGEGASDLLSCATGGGDQKENRVVQKKSSESIGSWGKDRPRTHQIVVQEAKPANVGGKKGKRAEAMRGYHPPGEKQQQQQQQQPKPKTMLLAQRRSGGSSTDQHSERENAVPHSDGGAIPGERRVLASDERLQRGSIRVVDDGGWVEEPERRAEIARRVISETRGSSAPGSGVGRCEASSDARFTSPVFPLKSAASVTGGQSRREHSDLMSDLNSVESWGEREESRNRGFGDSGEDEAEEDEEDEDEDEEEEYEGEVGKILRNGLKKHQLPASLSSHTHSPLLYRDSMTGLLNGRSTPIGRRKVGRGGAGSRDGERRPGKEAGISVRVAGKTPGRLRTRRVGVRASGLGANGGSSVWTDGELEVSELSRNGCGIPWYWTRVNKYRGRKFLDMAGRGLSCGTADDNKKQGNNNKLEGTQCRSNSQRDSVQSGDHSVSLGRSSRLVGERSSDFDPPSHHLEGQDGGAGGGGAGAAGVGISRADGTLLLGKSGELLALGSTREELSGKLVPTSPLGNESPERSLAARDSTGATLSLSQKYRPRGFGDVVGQSMVTKSLSMAVLKGKIAPVYLFQGPRGTGKSSAARIFAQALNCVSEKGGELTRPCGSCNQCNSPSLDIHEFDATTNNGADSVKALLGGMAGAPSASRCRVFIIEDCHCLTAEAWSTFLKAVEKPPWHVVFVLITADADKVPRTAVSRCQKFVFSKIKEGDILQRLRRLAAKEGLEVEDPALASVAARAQGSLRDAEALLDQLSLLGKKVTLSMVEEMVGLVPSERLIELLDLAMSAEAVSTVRCMRELLDGGVEPLALVSQLATLITDILAGSYVLAREKLNRGFFFRRSSSKEEAVRLRHALKVLSETEKQLRLSSDQPTWLTAALLQFAPDRSFQPSSLETSVVASPIAGFNEIIEKEAVGDSAHPWTSEEQTPYHSKKIKREFGSRREQEHRPSIPDKTKKKGATASYAEAKVHPAESPVVVCEMDSPEDKGSGRPSNARSDTPLLNGRVDDLNQKDFTMLSQRKLQEIWQRVLHGTRSNVLRQLLEDQGKLLSLLLSDAFAVAHVEFRQPEQKARAERSRSRICNAFQMALGCPVELQITLACMPGEHQYSFTSVEEQLQKFEGWHKEKKNTPDRRSRETKSSAQSRRRQRSTRGQRIPDSRDMPKDLYNAVMGDSKGFKPEILPVVSSSRWGRQNGLHEGPKDGQRHEESREARTFSVPLPRELRQMENSRAKYGPAIISRSTPGRVQLKTSIHQFDDRVAPSTLHDQPEVMCGSGSKRKSVKFKDAHLGHSASFERRSLMLESRFKPCQTNPRLLCWRMQKIDEDKIKMKRRRRKRRGTSSSTGEQKIRSTAKPDATDARKGCFTSMRDILRTHSERKVASGAWGAAGGLNNSGHDPHMVNKDAEQDPDAELRRVVRELGIGYRDAPPGSSVGERPWERQWVVDDTAFSDDSESFRLDYR